MMGDRDYRQLIKNAIESIGRDIEPKIDPKDNKTIHIHEVVRCLRRSYYDRTDPIDSQWTSFNNLMTGLLQKMEYGGKKGEGVIVYMTSDGKESSFSLSKDNKMFEEVVRRVRVLKDLLVEQKVPILEPSNECSSCQYYERCFIKQKIGKQINIQDLFGLGKSSEKN